MSQVIKPVHPNSSTADFVPKEKIEKDAKQILDLVWQGGVAILPLDVAYAIIGCIELAKKRILNADNRIVSLIRQAIDNERPDKKYFFIFKSTKK